MRVGIVHTFASTCRCHVTLERALLVLGHESVRCDSEDVPLRGDALAALDLVFDQTDVFRGEGVLRPVVRALLETRGARCVGTDARGCFLADDKLATRRVLEKAGVPMPALEGPFPRVVKPVHEQRSRGLAFVKDLREQEEAFAKARAEGVKALIVESYVEGRELAVTVLGGRVLPIVEWPLFGAEVLSYEAKMTGKCPAVAALDAATSARIGELALRAFEALGLQDWARFDVRLHPAKGPFFLEANTKPSLEEGSPCLVAAQAAGLDEAAFIAEIMAIAGRRLGAR